MAQVDAELEEDKDLDETQFAKFETGELNLPSDDDESDEPLSEVEDDEGQDLDDYYRELGIDPAEMRPLHKKSSSSIQSKSEKSSEVYVVREKKESA